LTPEQRIEKKARRLLLPLFQLSQLDTDFRDKVLECASELCKQGGMFVAAEVLQDARIKYSGV
jgi:hypothetical protein